MKDQKKTKEQLIGEVSRLRRRIAELEEVAGCCTQVKIKDSILLSQEEGRPHIDQHIFEEKREIVTYLKGSRLFSHLPDELLEQLLPLAELRYYPRETEILTEGEYNCKIFFLIKGEVGIYAGGKQILTLKRSGDIFGEMSIIGRKPCSASVIAETPVTAFSVKAVDIGNYTDINSDKLQDTLFRVFSMILTEKLSLTTCKAKHYEMIYENLLKEIAGRRDLEGQLRHSQKMQAMGTLSSGIAHEFNNILQIMVGYASVLYYRFSEDERKYVEEIYKAGDRGRRLIEQLLTFSRPSKANLKPIRLAILVKECIQMMRLTLPPSIEIHQQLAANCGTVLAEGNQIHQVLVNLLTNASHAMEDEKGAIEVNLQRVECDSVNTMVSELKEGAYLKLTVKDNGCGMTAEVREHIFEPFFTSKNNGKGTGLGLSVVHGIIKHHQGIIDVESEPGKGTTFDIYFPVIEEKPLEKSLPPKFCKKGRGHILFVDDELSLNTLFKELLEPLGYMVTCSLDSGKALQMFRDDPAAFDLVITDQGMPKMDGTSLAAEILKIKKVPIILLTGYGESACEKKFAAAGIYKYMKKPVDVSKLSGVLQDVFVKYSEVA